MGAWQNFIDSLWFSGMKSEDRKGSFKVGVVMLYSPFQLILIILFGTQVSQNIGDCCFLLAEFLPYSH